MVSELTTIGKILKGGGTIPATLVVFGKEANHNFYVQSIYREGDEVVIDGINTDSNTQERLDQDTEIFHVFVPRRL